MRNQAFGLTAPLPFYLYQVLIMLMKRKCFNTVPHVIIIYFQASSLPLSIIIVGIGDADFEGKYNCINLEIHEVASLTKYIYKEAWSYINNNNNKYLYGALFSTVTAQSAEG